MSGYPESPPFAYTALPDWNFDEVLTYTRMNSFLNNQEEIVSSYEIEHTLSSGEHKRIRKATNILQNPKARLGNKFWDSDFTPVIWTANTALGEMWTNTWASGAGGAPTHVSDAITVTNGVNLVLSFKISLSIDTYVSGSIIGRIDCYTAADAFISSVATTTISAAVAGFQTYEATEVTPATTAYVKVYFTNTISATTVGMFLTDVKCEQGTIASTFSDDSTSLQAVAKYRIAGGTSNPSIADASTEILDFETSVLDHPGADRVTTGAAWKFTAERFMRVNVEVLLSYAVAAWGATSAAYLMLVHYDSTPAVVRKWLLDGKQVETAVSIGVYLQGDIIISLNEGDYIQIEAYQSSGGPRTIETTLTIDGVANYLTSYISIHEVP